MAQDLAVPMSAAVQPPPAPPLPRERCNCNLAEEARATAEKLRVVLGTTVDPKGEHAIHALLHQRDDPTLTQAKAQADCGTSKGSMQKYRALLEQLHAKASDPAAALSESVKPLVKPGWLSMHTPSISELWVVSVENSNSGIQRRLRATLALPSGVMKRDIKVMFDPASGAAEANWKREAAALHELAAEWAELPPLQPADAGKKGVNIVRAMSGCHWRAGDWVWIPTHPVASYAMPVAAVAQHPTLAKVVRCFANGAIEVSPFDEMTDDFDASKRSTLPPARTEFEMRQQAMGLFSERPRYVGEIVRISRKGIVKNICIQDEFDARACKSVWRRADGQHVPNSELWCAPDDVRECIERCTPTELWRTGGDVKKIPWRCRMDMNTKESRSFLNFSDGALSADDLGVSGISWSALDYTPDLGMIVAIDLDREVVVQQARPGDTFCDQPWVCFGAVDIVLFNPLTAQYDGTRLSSVPLGPFIMSLGSKVSLAEARSLATAHVCRSASSATEQEARACVDRICQLRDVQAIASELQSLAYDASGVMDLIYARDFAMQQNAELERRIREQAILQWAQRWDASNCPPYSTWWKEVSERFGPGQLNAETAHQIASDLCHSFWLWNDEYADPNGAMADVRFYSRLGYDVSECTSALFECEAYVDSGVHERVQRLLPNTEPGCAMYMGQTLNDWFCFPAHHWSLPERSYFSLHQRSRANHRWGNLQVKSLRGGKSSGIITGSESSDSASDSGEGSLNVNADDEELPTAAQSGGGSNAHHSLCVQRSEPPSLLLPSLWGAALVFIYAYRSWVYAMIMHITIECARATMVYGGLYIVGVCLYRAAREHQ